MLGWQADGHHEQLLPPPAQSFIPAAVRLFNTSMIFLTCKFLFYFNQPCVYKLLSPVWDQSLSYLTITAFANGALNTVIQLLLLVKQKYLSY